MKFTAEAAFAAAQPCFGSPGQLKIHLIQLDAAGTAPWRPQSGLKSLRDLEAQKHKEGAAVCRKVMKSLRKRAANMCDSRLVAVIAMIMKTQVRTPAHSRCHGKTCSEAALDTQIPETPN